MQRVATTLATLALAAHGLTLRGATADHGSPAEAEQATLAELLEEQVALAQIWPGFKCV